MFWKRTPLTTRPPSTSRHGMTRLASTEISEGGFDERGFVLAGGGFVGREHRFGNRELVLVEGSADDRSRDPHGLQTGDGLEVLEVADAAGSDDGEVGLLGEADE